MFVFSHARRGRQQIIFFFSILGGAVTSGLGIYDTMQYVLPPISTWCVGQACSMGSLLLTAGTPGMRHSLPNSRIMIHQPSGSAVVSCICFLFVIFAFPFVYTLICNITLNVLDLCHAKVRLNQRVQMYREDAYRKSVLPDFQS